MLNQHTAIDELMAEPEAEVSNHVPEGPSEPPASSSTGNQLPTSIRGRLDRAKQLKQEGNQHFKDKGWKKAIKKYHHALMYCKGITDKLDFIPGLAAAGGVKASAEEEREATDITVAVSNNLAGENSSASQWSLLLNVLFSPCL